MTDIRRQLKRINSEIADYQQVAKEAKALAAHCQRVAATAIAKAAAKRAEKDQILEKLKDDQHKLDVATDIAMDSNS